MAHRIHAVRTRRVLLSAALLVILGAFPALAQDASVVYLEGEPEMRTAGGSLEWLDFGMSLTSGESVITGRNDFVELEQGAASSIRVEPDTVFTIREVEQGGRRQTVMSNSAGSVRYRFNQIAGRDEPRVGTTTVVAGIRGTEVTVYAGADGSSLFLVDSGEVEVTSQGETVNLTQNEGVEVAAGAAPGEKFEWLGDPIDFAEWNAANFSEFLAEPLVGITGVQTDLYELMDQSREYYALYESVLSELEAEREALEAIEDQEQFRKFRDEVVFPLQAQTGTAVLNYRFYALSALSLRRHVLGRMYMEMKTLFILDRDNPLYLQFVEKHEEIIRVFEDQITPYLVDVDI
jgi:hypothetical protein